MCKAGLGCHDDVQSNAVCKDWATRCYPNTWTNANGMGSYIVYVLYMDMLCWLMGEGLGMAQASQNVYSNDV